MGSNTYDRYFRIYEQLRSLFLKVDDPISRMASTVSLLHQKCNDFYWTGFYRLVSGRLLVGPYQGTLACMELKKDTGVCWHGINTKKSIIVPDVHKFPGHIACDSRSKSEIVIPLIDKHGTVWGVLDIDSIETDSFDKNDQQGLELIVSCL